MWRIWHVIVQLRSGCAEVLRSGGVAAKHPISGYGPPTPGERYSGAPDFRSMASASPSPSATATQVRQSSAHGLLPHASHKPLQSALRIPPYMFRPVGSISGRGTHTKAPLSIAFCAKARLASNSRTCRGRPCAPGHRSPPLTGGQGRRQWRKLMAAAAEASRRRLRCGSRSVMLSAAGGDLGHNLPGQKGIKRADNRAYCALCAPSSRRARPVCVTCPGWRGSRVAGARGRGVRRPRSGRPPAAVPALAHLGYRSVH